MVGDRTANLSGSGQPLISYSKVASKLLIIGIFTHLNVTLLKRQIFCVHKVALLTARDSVQTLLVM